MDVSKEWNVCLSLFIALMECEILYGDKGEMHLAVVLGVSREINRTIGSDSKV